MSCPTHNPLRDALRKLPGFSFSDSILLSFEAGVEAQDALFSRAYDASSSTSSYVTATAHSFSFSPAAPETIVNQNLVVLFRAILYYADFYFPIKRHPEFFTYIAQDCFPQWQSPKLVAQFATLVNDARRCFLDHSRDRNEPQNHTSPLPDLVDRCGQLFITGADPLVSRQTYPDETNFRHSWSLRRSELKHILKEFTAHLFDTTIIHLTPPGHPPVIPDQSQVSRGAMAPSIPHKPDPEDASPRKYPDRLKRDRDSETDGPRKRKPTEQQIEMFRSMADQVAEQMSDQLAQDKHNSHLQNEIEAIQNKRLPSLESTVDTLRDEVKAIAVLARASSDKMDPLEPPVPKAPPPEFEKMLRTMQDDLHRMQEDLRARNKESKSAEESHKHQMASNMGKHTSLLEKTESMHQQRAKEEEAAFTQRKILMEAIMEEKLAAADQKLKAADERFEQAKELAKQYNAKLSECLSWRECAEKKYSSHMNGLEEKSQMLRHDLEGVYSKTQMGLKKVHCNMTEALRGTAKKLQDNATEQSTHTRERFQTAERVAQNLRTNDYKMKSEGLESKMKKWDQHINDAQKSALRCIETRSQAQKVWVNDENDKFARQFARQLETSQTTNLKDIAKQHKSLVEKLRSIEASQEKNLKTLTDFSVVLDPAVAFISKVEPQLKGLKGDLMVIQTKISIQEQRQATAIADAAAASSATTSKTAAEQSTKMGQLEKSMQSIHNQQQAVEKTVSEVLRVNQEFERKTADRQQQYEKTTHQWALDLIQNRIHASLSQATSPIANAAGPAVQGAPGHQMSPAAHSPSQSPGNRSTNIEELHDKIVRESKTRSRHIEKLDKVIRTELRPHIDKTDKQVADLVGKLHSQASAEAAKVVNAATIPAGDVGTSLPVVQMRDKVDQLTKTSEDHSRRLHEHEVQAETLQDMVTSHDSNSKEQSTTIKSLETQLRDHQKKISTLMWEKKLK